MSPYVEQNILNADPLELIRILYRHGIFSIRDAREHLRQGRKAVAAQSMLRASNVIAELDRALRPEAAPEIADRLRKLYEYMQRRVLEASLHYKDEALAEVLGLMTTLSEAWQFGAAPLAAAPSGIAWQAAMSMDAAGARIEVCA